jgi:cell wall-associated NlpC family hydrolase
MKSIIKRTYILIIFLFSIACDDKQAILDHSENIIRQIKEENAPDKRVALFDIEPVYNKESIVLRGESNLPGAVERLKLTLEAERIPYLDSIQILPEADLEGKVFGVVTLSVANLRSEPKHSAELATQATLGTPLKVLKKRRGWYLVQTPDNYISWVDRAGFISMSKEEFDRWLSSEKVIYTKPFGFSYEEAKAGSQTISDLVSGNILTLAGTNKDYYKVKYPNGATAFVAKDEMLPYKEWVASLNPTGTSLVSTSKKLMGLPYLWGGTSFKGVDCSGFTKTVYFLNGMVIPRDASQQVHAGQLIDSVRSFENLLPGDLLFFGRPATENSSERVVHVGMWIGNNEFIHSAGYVHISSVDSTAENFDEYNYNRYLRTRRLLQQSDEKVVELNNSRIF